MATMSILAQRQVFAQGPSSQDVDRAQLLQGQTQPTFGPTTTPEGVVDGHAVESPNDPDIGQQEILKRVTQYNPWVAALATPVFYTSNVALTNRGEVSDVVFAPVAAFFYEPQLAKTLYGHIGAREQVFYYGKYTTFDFASLDCEAGLTYFMPQFHNLILRGWYDFNRLTQGDQLGAEFFSNHAVILNAELPFHLSRANGRTDVSEIISATATYRVNDWIWISAISSFAHSDSNQDVFDYDVGNGGGVLELSLRF